MNNPNGFWKSLQVREEYERENQRRKTEGVPKKLSEEELLSELPANCIPYDVLDAAIHDFMKALGINQQKRKKELEKDANSKFQFEMKFRSKKNMPQETLEFATKLWNTSRGKYARLFSKKTPLRFSEHVPDKLDRQFYVMRNRLGCYFLSYNIEVPIVRVPSSDDQAQDKRKRNQEAKEKQDPAKLKEKIQEIKQRGIRKTVQRNELTKLFGPRPSKIQYSKDPVKRHPKEQEKIKKKRKQKKLKKKKEKKLLKNENDEGGNKPNATWNHVPFHRIVALDPGVRCFQTIYDPDGLAVEWGQQDIQRIYRLCRHADKLKSQLDSTKDAIGPKFNKLYGQNAKTRKRYRRKLKKAWLRVLTQIKNLVNEVHKKLCKWLCDNYEVILIPEFRVSQMVNKKNKRKIRSKTARQMCTWAHYRFRKMLEAKAQTYQRCRVIVVQEPYTTKTCGGCGELNEKIGSKKVFICPFDNCDYEADRDISAARNILLRFLTHNISVLL